MYFKAKYPAYKIISFSVSSQRLRFFLNSLHCNPHQLLLGKMIEVDCNLHVKVIVIVTLTQERCSYSGKF